MKPPYSSKLIILRGNSASGKSTVAKRLRELSGRKIALVEQDIIRRTILNAKDADDAAYTALIAQIVEFALAREYDVILEGILKFRRYSGMLSELVAKCPEHYVYYFDVSLEETLRRHATKPIATEVDGASLADFYRAQDVTGYEGEVIIPESSGFDETVRLIFDQTGL